MLRQGNIQRIFSLKLILLSHLVITLDGGWTKELWWTPIYVDSTNRVDLWTLTSTGCECPGGKSYTCACCVKPGGCLCLFSHNKCSQCGLEDVCQRFCNVTMSSRTLAARSGVSWVEIRSPELQGPTSCWWRLDSAPGQRIEVQIHRLLSVGSYDNVTQLCSGGFLQFLDGDTSTATSQDIQLCAQNARYSPPIVMFGDQGIAMLLLSNTMQSSRSTLVAYVSFSSVDDPSVGNPSRGGRLQPHSVCDWTFEHCWNAGNCVLSSPGFPGVYPPYRRCRYILNANQTASSIYINFHWLNIPPSPLCSNHHVAIWKRKVSDLANVGAPWRTLCHEESDVSIEVESSWVLIEFRSGANISPYLHNGFRATVQFIHKEGKRTSSLSPSGISSMGVTLPIEDNFIMTPFPTIPTVIKNINIYERTRNTMTSHGNNHNINSEHYQVSTPPQLPLIFNPPSYDENDEDNMEEPFGYPRASFETAGVFPITCSHVFDGLTTRGSVFRLIFPKTVSHFQTRNVGQVFGPYHVPFEKTKPSKPLKCSLEFRGKPSDVVQVAIFNYKYRGLSCSSFTEAYDMDEEALNQTEKSDRLLGKLCGPSGNEVKRFTSSHNRLVLITTVSPYVDPLGSEFLEGAFRFHDESIEGTVKPLSSCEVVYYGVTSSSTGPVVGPPDSPLLRLSTFPLVCAHSFFPGGNQTVSLTLHKAGHETSGVALPGSKKYCRTFCGNSGCRCEAKYTPLDQIDHLLLIAGSNNIGCLCGYFPDALPMTFETRSPLTLVYHATKGGREFSYSASFHFRNRLPCSNFSIAPPTGSKRWREILSAETLSFYAREFHHYSFYECTWYVSVPPRYNLSIDFISEEDEKDCNTWNLTVWTRPPKNDESFEALTYFCARHGRLEVKIPENVHQAYIRLVGVTLRPPQFEVRWKYTDVILPGLSEINVSDSGTRTCHAKSCGLSVLLLVYMIFETA